MMGKKVKRDKYISLQKATDICNYSQEYLSLRARQGKLKAKKLGRNWVTTKKWLKEYLKHIKKHENNLNNNNVHKAQALHKNSVLDGLRSLRSQAPFLLNIAKPILRVSALALLVLSIGTGVVFGYPFFQEKVIEPIFAGADLLKDYVNQDISFLGFIFSEANEQIKGIAQETKLGFKKIAQEISIQPKKIVKAFLGTIAEATGKTFEKIVKAFQKTIYSISYSIREINYAFKNAFKNILKNTKNFGNKIVKVFGKGYKFLVYPWSEEIDEQKLIEQILEERPGIEKQEIERIRIEIEKLKTEGITSKEIIKEVSKIVQILPEKQITKETIITKIDDEELEKLRLDIANIQKWGADIESLQNLTQKIQSQPPQMQYVSSPVYIGSSGLQVGGAATFSSLVVSGQTGVSNLGVGGSATLGFDASDQLTVNAASNFLSPVTIRDSFIVGDATNYLTIDSSGNLITTGNLTAAGDVTINGNFTVTGAQSYSGAAAIVASSTSAAFSVNQTGSGDIVNFQDSGTTVFVISDSGDITMTDNVTIIGSATTTGSMYAETYHSTSTDSTVRKIGEEVMRDMISIYRFGIPSQTSATSSYVRISKIVKENPFTDKPETLPGATRVYRFNIKYADDLATGEESLWRIYDVDNSTTTATFVLPRTGNTILDEGTSYITEVVAIPTGQWQLGLKLPTSNKSIRIFDIFLSAYDEIL